MVSFKLRRVFYNAAACADDVILRKRKDLAKIEEIEVQISLAKKIMSKIENQDECDAVTLIRMEGKLKKLETKLKQRRNSLTI